MADGGMAKGQETEVAELRRRVAGLGSDGTNGQGHCRAHGSEAAGSIVGASNSSPAILANELLAVPRAVKCGSSRLEELNREFLTLITNTFTSGSYAADYSPFVREYLERVRRIEDEGGGDMEQDAEGDAEGEQNK